ncbi:DUF805 domain-containing protein [Kineococcus sp. LSe6-4]|uniref:DUF805 domain-containing protein n=1 Tax=Kineococcus halophytocola TaxID=3234027 RepID=A0ABV4GW50_9ACTN
MNFQTAIKTGFSQYVTFSGRARRSEYWYWVLFNVLVGVVASILDAVLDTSTSRGVGLFSTITSLALLLPSLAIFWRRMHDIGKPGLWFLAYFIPIANIVFAIVFIVWFCQDSQPGPNQYGPNPKGLDAGHGQFPGQPPQFGGPNQYGQPGRS